MSHKPSKIILNSILVGDELGQIKLIQFDDAHEHNNECKHFHDDYVINNINKSSTSNEDYINHRYSTQLTSHQYTSHKIVRIVDDGIEREPAASRAIISIRPILKIHDSCIDTTEKPNNLFLIANKVGQVFVCNSDAIKLRLKSLERESQVECELENARVLPTRHQYPMLSPIYYNQNSKAAQICGAQPVNQTNIIVIYKNGDLQHVDISQNVLQSTLGFKTKAIKLLGLGYNSDAKAMNWRIDGKTGGVSYEHRFPIIVNSNNNNNKHNNETVPRDCVVTNQSGHHHQSRPYEASPCKTSQRHNKTNRLVPPQVLDMVMSHDSHQASIRVCKWSSITSLNLIYKKLALYDLVGLDDLEAQRKISPSFGADCFKMSSNYLAVAGRHYAIRVYDVNTQKAVYNCRTGSKSNPLHYNKTRETDSVSDLEWLGGNKTTLTLPNMIASCSGVDATVRVYDLRSSRPVFDIDLTKETEICWNPYFGHPKGCQFTRIASSGAPYSTAVPSQQIAVGSKDGQLHIIDLRFPSKSYTRIGKLTGFCGGGVRKIRFVSESFDTTKMVSCASDRFVRVHKFHTSFTSVISQKLTSRIFVGTRPICIQPICHEHSYSNDSLDRNSFGSNMSTLESWFSD